jgi:hypothetical protein
MMMNKHTPLRGNRAFFAHRRRFGRESFGLFLLIWGCFLLYANSWDGRAWGADAGIGQDQFMEKLQLPRNPESVLKEVLSRSEFRDSENESLADKLRAMLFDTLQRILAWIRDRIPSVKLPEAELDVFWTVIGSFVVAAALVLVAVVVFYATKSWWRKKPDTQEFADWDTPDATTSADVRVNALKSAEQDNFREALISMFRYVLLWLDERGRLSLHQVKTNREVLESLRGDKTLRSALGEMIPIFNRVRYGNYPCEKNDYEKFLALCSRVDGGT